MQRDKLILFLEIYPSQVHWYHDGKEADLGNAFLVNKPCCLSSEFSLRFFRRVHRLMVVSGMNISNKKLIKRLQASAAGARCPM